jgi:chaperonin cofactor prefoldin
MEPTLRSLLARIHARRAVLRAQCALAEQEYNRLEHARVQLDRQLCVMHGALDELDALVKDAPALPATGEG